MKKLITILTALTLTAVTSTSIVSCLSKEIEIHYSQMTYEYLSKQDTKIQVPKIQEKIESYGNDFMKENITNHLHLNIKEEEINFVESGLELNSRQTELLVDSLSANLRIYKIIDSNTRLNPELFSATWSVVDTNLKKFTADIFFDIDLFVTMSGDYFTDNKNPIDEINEITFSQIADQVYDDNKISTSSVGAFWGIDFIGEKYTPEEQNAMWIDGGKYENYEWQEKQTMTWKGQQKININQLKQTMTDYLSSRLRMSGVIQSNLELKYEQLEFNINGFIGSSTKFTCKTDVPNCEDKYNKATVEEADSEFYYFAEESDFGATTMIQVNTPTIWYKGYPDVTINQGGSIFQTHLEYKW